MTGITSLMSAAPPPAPGTPRLGDAFGALLLDCWEQGAKPGAILEGIERDDGFLDFGDAARYFAGYDAWGPLDRWACARARGRVLDVGAGAGRHALYLQARDCDVVALDVSPLALEVCRRRGVRQTYVGTAAHLTTAGPEPFDALLLLGNNLGLLANAEEAPLLLAALAALARPGAVLVGRSREWLRTDRPVHLTYHERNRTLGRLLGQVRLRVRYRELATDWFDYLFLSVEELRSLVAGSAWAVERHEAEGANYAVVLRHTGESLLR